MGVKKYFLAIVVPAPLQEKIEALKNSLFLQHGLKGALRSPSHITLHRPFEWKEEKESALIERLKSFRFQEPFHIEICHFDFFVPRVVYVNVVSNETLFKLHDQLKQFAVKELKLFNELEDKRGFHPHVTIAFRDLKKPIFYELQEEFKKKRLSESFNYSGFSLLKLDKKWEEIKLFTQ